MLEGSFRPPSAPSASAHLHHYSHSAPSAAHSADQPALSAFRRKDLPPPPPSRAPSFTPITLHQHSPSYDPEEHTSPPSPPHLFHHPQAHRPSQPTPASNISFRSTDPSSLPQKPDLKPAEAGAKDPSFGPVRAKKKPAGSACNSCHRLKTRCSGGYPCDRCAAHKVPCQFDRDLIYRSPLASSSQQASARNAQVLNTVNRKPLDSALVSSKPPRVRSTNVSSSSTKSTYKRPTAPPPPPVQPQQATQIPPPIPLPAVPTHVEAVAQLPRSTPSPIPVPVRPVQQVLSHPSNVPRKPPPIKSAIPPAPNPPETFLACDPNSSAAAFNHSVNLRLSALENNLSSVLQILRPQASLVHSRLAMPDQPRAPSPIPAPPMLLASSSTAIGPEEDRRNDANRLGHGPVNGDLLTDAILDSSQIQYLYDVFVDYCLPSLPILHRVQISMIRARSPFLFSTMLAIGARFCSTQSVAQPSSNLTSLSATPKPITAHPNTRHIGEPTYARLVSLAYQHLSSTLLKSCHSLDDVRAILFLSSWSLVSNEDGPPNRWVLVGHAARIGRSMGLERLARDLNSSDGWANADQHSLKRDQLDALKTDYAMCSLEAFLSTTLRLEPTRDYFPRPSNPAGSTKPNIVQLATGSPFQYDIVSTAQIQSMAELADIWADATSFLTSADDRNRKLSAEQLVDLGERHNTSLDGWAKKWTWHASSWAHLLGNYLRTVRLLSESLRITLNLALTNVLHAYITSSAGSIVAARFQETLSIALERVNGASTAVIQAHRDSAREGFSLAFAPDLITDGLVSAALTVLQLASPFVHSFGRGPVPSPGGQLLPEEEQSTTPSEKGDMEMSDVTTTTHKSSSIHPQPTTANSSPAATPHAEHSNSGESLGKKPLMEPAVAAHYIRMATDALRASDRSQTRLGTNMACKIISLAERAGLLPRVAGASSQPVKAVAPQKAEERRRSETSVGGRIQTSLAGGDDEASVSGGRRASTSSEKMGEDDDEAEEDMEEEEEEEEIDGEEGEEDAENLSVRTENAENLIIEDEADYMTGGKAEDDDAFKYINEHYEMEFEDHK